MNSEDFEIIGKLCKLQALASVYNLHYEEECELVEIIKRIDSLYDKISFEEVERDYGDV